MRSPSRPFTLAQVDRSALEAARDLGANWWGTFREVILPQTMPGIVIGSIFIFVLTMGDYGTVATVGGGNITSVGTLIYSKIGADLSGYDIDATVRSWEGRLPDDSFRALRRLATRAPWSTRLSLLLGDLNLQPPAAQPILESAGFTVAEHGPTYPADAPRIRLDYVAVDGLRVGGVRVAAPATVSDHRAVVADLVP